jgi:hypothetical protein
MENRAGQGYRLAARADAALPVLANIIEDPSVDPAKNLKFFRAFDFHTDLPGNRYCWVCFGAIISTGFY